MSRTRYVTLLIGGLSLATGFAQGQIARPPVVETDEAGPAKMFSVKPRPTPRSLAVPDAFIAAPDAVLPALSDEDVVGAGGTNPMVNGRVYEWGATTELDGLWTDLPDGSRLWTYSIQSPNAAALRLRFEPFAPAAGTELIVFSATNSAEAVGPYTSSDARPGFPLWTSRISDTEARVEWFVPADLVAAGKFGSLQITGVVQIFPQPAVPRLDCRIDVTCHPEWNTTAQSVAQYDFIEGTGSFICSGSMITRTPEDFCPLFLTAAHCISSQASAVSMNIFWFFQTSICDGVPPDPSTLPRTDGATLLRRDTDSDTCLLGLPVDDIPAGIVWAGWSSAEAPDPTPATLIHHPLGMRKSWSPGSLNGIETVSQCFGTASTTYDFQLSNGGQDGGSSGSPVFDNANHRVRAVATCSESDDCIPAENTGEGSFAAGFPNMSPYLNAPTDVWVQSGWAGAESGSALFPFDTLTEGWFSVRGGGTLHLRTGTGYPTFNFLGPRGMTVVAEGGIVRIGG